MLGHHLNGGIESKPFVCYITEHLIKKVAREDNLKNITVLNFHNKSEQNEKIRFIENLTNVPNLTELVFSSHQIAKIEGISHLAKLQVLCLSSNRITKTEGLESLVSLEILDLSFNLIERIPASLKKNQSLKKINLAKNNINALQDVENLRDLAQLTSFNVDSNPILSLPHAISFIVYTLPTLDILNGDSVTIEDRKDALDRYSRTEEDRLRAEVARLEEVIRQMKDRHEKTSDLLKKTQSTSDIKSEEIASLKEEVKRLRSENESKSIILERRMSELNSTTKTLFELQQEMAFIKIDRSNSTVDPDSDHHIQRSREDFHRVSTSFVDTKVQLTQLDEILDLKRFQLRQSKLHTTYASADILDAERNIAKILAELSAVSSARSNKIILAECLRQTHRLGPLAIQDDSLPPHLASYKKDRQELEELEHSQAIISELDQLMQGALAVAKRMEIRLVSPSSDDASEADLQVDESELLARLAQLVASVEESYHAYRTSNSQISILEREISDKEARSRELHSRSAILQHELTEKEDKLKQLLSRKESPFTGPVLIPVIRPTIASSKKKKTRNATFVSSPFTPYSSRSAFSPSEEDRSPSSSPDPHFERGMTPSFSEADMLDMEGKLHGMETLITNLHQENQSLREELARSRHSQPEDSDQLEQTLHEAQQTIVMLAHKVGDLERQLEAVEASNTDTDGEMSLMKTVLESKDQRIRANESLHQADRSSPVQTLRRQTSRQQTLIETLQDEIAGLRAVIQEQEMRSSNAAHLDEMQSLREQVESLTETITIQKSSLENMQKQLHHEHQKIEVGLEVLNGSMFDESTRDADSLLVSQLSDHATVKERKDLEMDKERLFVELDRLHREIERMQVAIREAETSLRTKKIERENLSKEVDELNREVGRLGEVVKSRTHEIARIEADVYETQKTAAVEVQKVKSERDRALDVERERQDKLQELNNIMAETRERKQDLDKMRARMHDLERLNAEIRHAQQQRDRLDAEVSVDTTRATALKSEVEEARKQLGRMAREEAEKRIELELIDKELHTAKQLLQDKTKQLDDYDEKQRAAADLRKEVAELSASKKSLSVELIQMKSTADDIRGKIATHERELERLTKQVGAMETNFASKSSISLEVENLKQSKTKLQEEVRELTARLEDTQAEYLEAVEFVNNRREEINRLARESPVPGDVIDRSKDIRAMAGQLDNLRSELASTKEKLLAVQLQANSTSTGISEQQHRKETSRMKRKLEKMRIDHQEEVQGIQRVYNIKEQRLQARVAALESEMSKSADEVQIQKVSRHKQIRTLTAALALLANATTTRDKVQEIAKSFLKLVGKVEAASSRLDSILHSLKSERARSMHDENLASLLEERDAQVRFLINQLQSKSSKRDVPIASPDDDENGGAKTLQENMRILWLENRSLRNQCEDLAQKLLVYSATNSSAAGIK